MISFFYTIVLLAFMAMFATAYKYPYFFER